jgi:hypothetical protein
LAAGRGERTGTEGNSDTSRAGEGNEDVFFSRGHGFIRELRELPLIFSWKSLFVKIRVISGLSNFSGPARSSLPWLPSVKVQTGLNNQPSLRYGAAGKETREQSSFDFSSLVASLLGCSTVRWHHQHNTPFRSRQGNR